MSDDWTAANPRQHPPFEDGNAVALVHGARSERRIAPRAQAILDELESARVLPDYLDDQSFRPAVMSYCRAEAICELLTEHIADLPIEKATKGALPVLEQLRRWTSTAATLRRSLGLDPLSRATLTKDLVTARATAQSTVAAIAAEGRQTSTQTTGATE